MAKNIMLCLGCGDVLESKYRHDFQMCDCDNQSFVDGGREDYIRCGGVDMSLIKLFDSYEDLVDYCQEELEKLKNDSD